MYRQAKTRRRGAVAVATTLLVLSPGTTPIVASPTVIPTSDAAYPIVKVADVRKAAAERATRTRRAAVVELADKRQLSDQELHDLLVYVGFEGKTLRTAWAVAKRESNGRPRAHNDNRQTGDNSYGLFQINMIGDLGPARRDKYELASNNDLFDPVTTARIAYKMTSGGDNWSSWGIGPNAYSNANEPAYKEWLAKYPF